MLSEEALQEFKRLFLEEFEEEISDEQAIDMGTSLLNLFDHIYRPLKKKWVEEIPEDKEPINP